MISKRTGSSQSLLCRARKVARGQARRGARQVAWLGACLASSSPAGHSRVTGGTCLIP